MNFNTAIFYDIENLIGGYGNMSDYLPYFSLKDVYQDIIKKEVVEGIAIQRAYADWSNPRLGIMRGHINELGIEPIQIFGFGKGLQLKNASDIHLAVDAVDVAFSRDTFKIFVIVSGDGGFSALAKKLHEYGKFVIGCAYENSTNRVFKELCDDFIRIDEPKYEEDQSRNIDDGKITYPRLKSFTKDFEPLNITDRDEIEKISKEILNYFSDDGETQDKMKNSGLNISIINQALIYRIKNFTYHIFGFTKLVDFLRFVCNGTKFCVIHSLPSDYRISLKGSNIDHFVELEPISSIEEIHTSENYVKILSINSPYFNILSNDAVFQIAHYFTNHFYEMQEISIGDIIEKLGSQFEYEQKIIKETVYSFISAGCFHKKPEGMKLMEQTLSLKELSKEKMIESLRTAMFDKISNLLGKVNEEEFSKIIG